MCIFAFGYLATSEHLPATNTDSKHRPSTTDDHTFKMSTQSYYKDRLGFDPREALYEERTSTTTTTKAGRLTVQHSSSGDPNQHHQQQQQHHHQERHHHQQIYESSSASGSPATKKLKKNAAARVAAANAANNNNNGNGNGNVTVGILVGNNNGQGGYEDALTQFKGTMSVWNYFVENWDITGTSEVRRTRKQPVSFGVCTVWSHLRRITLAHPVVFASVPFSVCASARRFSVAVSVTVRRLQHARNQHPAFAR